MVTGGDPVELAGDGVFEEHNNRYEITDEFLHIWRSILADRGEVNFEGKHLRVRGAKAIFKGVQRPYPPLYFGGSSAAGIEVAARHVDYYLTWGEPPSQVAEKIATARKAAARHGRELRFGIRLHVIVRETEEEAWKAADRLISHLTDETVEKAQATLARQDSDRTTPDARTAEAESGTADARSIGNQPESLGRSGFGSRWRRNRPGRERGQCRRADAGVSPIGNRDVYLVWISPPGRGLPSRGTALPPIDDSARERRIKEKPNSSGADDRRSGGEPICSGQGGRRFLDRSLNDLRLSKYEAAMVLLDPALGSANSAVGELAIPFASRRNFPQNSSFAASGHRSREST